MICEDLKSRKNFVEEDFIELRDSVEGLISVIEKYKLTIPENVKNEIGYWLTDMQGEIRTEEEKNLFKEIREKLNLKKIYKNWIY